MPDERHARRVSELRVPRASLETWRAATEARQSLRGVSAIAAEMASHLRRTSTGDVSIARHTLFQWAEALEGAAHRDARAASAGPQLSLPQVVADIRGALGGGAPAGAAAPALPVPPPVAVAPPTPAPRSEPAPVTYARGGAGASGGGFVAAPEVGDAIRRALREAQNEVLVISPWQFGLDSLADDLARLSSSVAVRLLTRRPDKDEPSYHSKMESLTRKGAEVRFSPFLQTRMVIVDGRVALVGAASVPASGAPTREAAARIEGEGAKVAREHFARVFDEAGR